MRILAIEWWKQVENRIRAELQLMYVALMGAPPGTPRPERTTPDPKTIPSGEDGK